MTNLKRASASNAAHATKWNALLHSLKNANSKAHVAYIDFKNAFNSCDMGAVFKILEAWNIPDLDLLREIYNATFARRRRAAPLGLCGVHVVVTAKGTKVWPAAA